MNGQNVLNIEEEDEYINSCNYLHLNYESSVYQFSEDIQEDQYLSTTPEKYAKENIIYASTKFDNLVKQNINFEIISVHPNNEKKNNLPSQEDILINENNKKKLLGRKKRKDESLGKHTKESVDNIFRKIKTVYHKFIIDFLNYIIEDQLKVNKDFILRKFCSEFTTNITIQYNKEILSKKLFDIFVDYHTSPRFKNFSNAEAIIKFKNCNNKLINYILNLTYLEFFEKWFCQSKCPNDLYEEYFTKCVNLTKFREYDKSYSDVNYYNLFEKIAIENYANHFLNKSPRKPKKIIKEVCI